MGQGHHDQPGRGPNVPRPAFDLVARGYDAEQVDGYIHALWRYASDLTARVAAAEAALRHERDRRAADERTDPGVRVGRMLAIAQQMADEIVGGARLTAEQTLFDAVREAGASHPIAQEAREQADKLLADAAAEARRIARERHEDLEAQITEATRRWKRFAASRANCSARCYGCAAWSAPGISSAPSPCWPAPAPTRAPNPPAPTRRRRRRPRRSGSARPARPRRRRGPPGAGRARAERRARVGQPAAPRRPAARSSRASCTRWTPRR